MASEVVGVAGGGLGIGVDAIRAVVVRDVAETALGRAGGGRRRFRSRYALDEGYEAAYETVV